jgi:hypothetical protein
MVAVAGLVAVAPGLGVGAAFGQNIPKDAKYTILLLRYTDPDHVRMSKLALETSKKKSGLKDFFLVHSDSESVLYYGGYKEIDPRLDSDEAMRFREDMQRLANVVIDGSRPFGGAIGAGLPTPDPEAPAEWNIRNAEGTWSLEIAAFKDRPDRKQAAVDAVKELRKENVPAYYFHGPTTSSVLIGAFPASAVEIVEGSAKADAGKEIVVIPYRPPGVPDEVVQPDGTTSRVVAPSFKVVDPTLAALLKRDEFREHSVNGQSGWRRQDPKTGKVVEQRDESFLVDITKIKNDSILNANVPRPAGASPDSLVPAAQTPGSGLRKVGG